MKRPRCDVAATRLGDTEGIGERLHVSLKAEAFRVSLHDVAVKLRSRGSWYHAARYFGQAFTIATGGVVTWRGWNLALDPRDANETISERLRADGRVQSSQRANPSSADLPKLPYAWLRPSGPWPQCLL